MKQSWIAAACLLGKSPNAQVPCPDCGHAYLNVVDHHVAGSDGFERILQCPVCQASTAMRKVCREVGQLAEAERPLPGILAAMEETASHGHIFLMKKDGARPTFQHTFVISVPNDPQAAIRMDCNDPVEGLKAVMARYRAYLNTI